MMSFKLLNCYGLVLKPFQMIHNVLFFSYNYISYTTIKQYLINCSEQQNIIYKKKHFGNNIDALSLCCRLLGALQMTILMLKHRSHFHVKCKIFMTSCLRRRVIFESSIKMLHETILKCNNHKNHSHDLNKIFRN